MILVLRNAQDDETLPVNKHILQPPFHEDVIRGDIVLMRNNEEGIPGKNL